MQDAIVRSAEGLYMTCPAAASLPQSEQSELHGKMQEHVPSRDEIVELCRRIHATPQATLQELSNTLSYKQLLDKHKHLKLAIRGPLWTQQQKDEYDELNWALLRINRLMRNIKKERCAEKKEATCNELNEAWRHRQTKQAWKLAMGMGLTAPRRKFRRFDYATLMAASAEEWEQQCQQAGPDGGMQGLTIDYEQETARICAMDHQKDDPLYTKVPTADHISQAEALVARLKIRANKMKLGKSTVSHSIPNEIFRMILKPAWVLTNRYRFGIGHAGKLHVPDIILKVLTRLYAKVLSTRLVPLKWHLAAGFAIKKLGTNKWA